MNLVTISIEKVQSFLLRYLPSIIAAGIMLLVLAGPAFAANVAVCPDDQFKPLCDFANSANPFGNIVKFVVTILLVATVVISLVFLIWGGIRWIISGGDKAGVESARNTIIASIIGLVVAFVAFLIIQLVANAFKIGDVFNLKLPTVF